MTGSLIAAGLLMGLASSPHCALMCGAPCAAIARSCGGPRSDPGLARLACRPRGGLHRRRRAWRQRRSGWIASWAAGSAFVRPLWTMLQAAVLVLGLALLVSGRMPRWVNGASQSLARAVPVRGPHAASRPAERGGQRCSVWAGSPCRAPCCTARWWWPRWPPGPSKARRVMAAFAVGSAPGLAGRAVPVGLAVAHAADGGAPDRRRDARRRQRVGALARPGGRFGRLVPAA